MSQSSWNSRATLELVLEAKNQRSEAWAALYERCAVELRDFCRFFFGTDDELRRFCETQDILNEAFVLAMENIEHLKNDASFYAWVRTIIRRRISLNRRDALRDSGNLEGDDRMTLDSFEKELALADDSVRVLDAILELFPEYPQAMSVFTYVHLEEGISPEKLVDKIGLSRRTVYRRLDEAARLLRARIEGES